jgi:hypothetical protein
MFNYILRIILNQSVLVTPVTILRVSYNKNKLTHNSKTKMYDKNTQHNAQFSVTNLKELVIEK